MSDFRRCRYWASTSLRFAAGILAVLAFTPRHGATVMSPVVGGSSHSSQHALERVFGLGAARRGSLDVAWPGGVRNRLLGVRAGERGFDVLRAADPQAAGARLSLRL